VTPRISCKGYGSVFVASPADTGEYNHGQLRLGDASRFSLVQVDPDGSGLKMLNFATNLLLSKTQASDDTPQASTVPSLRGAGLSVARLNRGVQFARAADRGKTLNDSIVTAAGGGGVDPMMSLEDVTRGWYIDVWDEHSKRWHSLSNRTGFLHFTSIPEDVTVPPTDAASVTPTPTQAADPAAPKDMYLQESYFQWKGWSLAAPQPGYQILADDSAGPPPVTPPPFPLVFGYHAARGTLPRLRFATTYQVRMRAADLAGNSIPSAHAAAAGDPNLVASITFQRFEPVQSPAVIPTAPRTEGESVERLVLRSNYNVNPSPATSARHIVPAKTAQRMAEFHGLFDVNSGPRNIVDQNAYALIVSRESQSITGTQDPSDPPGSIYVDKLTATPYLPDLLARGAAFQGLPGTTAVYTWNFLASGQKWPNYTPFRLVISQPPHPHELGPPGPPKPGSDANGPYLAVQLPKAEVVQVRLSSTLLSTDLPLLGLWTWGGAALNPTDAVQGRMWMLTPFQVLTLVHAVRQPLKTPEFTNPSVQRDIGQTFATIVDVMTFSRKSTGKVEMYATWQEPVDQGPGQAPPSERNVNHTLAFPVNLDRSFTGGQLDDLHLDLSEEHPFYDTKHRIVTYSAVASTKFAEYFVQRKTFTVTTVPASFTLDSSGVVDGSVGARDAIAGTPFTENADFTVNAVNGRITFPTGSAAKGKTVEVAYLVPPITRETAPPPLGNGPKTLSVPSSARPPIPNVLYVVPTFAWSTPGSGKSMRASGGLRVYMERPWFATGEGEMLGVVLWPGGGGSDPPDSLVPYVTDWGRDPLFSSGSLPSRHPDLSSFPLSPSAQQGTGLALDELPGVPVNVAGHTLDLVANYDATRDLWFCDIDVASGKAYTPFIRLALARYQPNSVVNSNGDMRLSRIVLADFMQLAPDRSASVIRVGQTIRASVTGTGYFQSTAGAGPGTMRLTLQQRDATITNELGWDDVSSQTVNGSTAGDGTASWGAGATLPSAYVPGKFRLVLEQFDTLLYDAGPGGPGPTPRIVYTDIIVL
jgi:hypothetical protein